MKGSFRDAISALGAKIEAFDPASAQCSPSSPPSFRPPELSIDRLKIELLEIEIAARPVEILVMLGILGIRNRLHKLLITPYTAAVLGRGRSLSSNADRIFDFRIRWEYLLHQDLVNPAVPKVVFVEKSRLLSEGQLAKLNPFFGRPTP
jgi:hypothetical protein